MIPKGLLIYFSPIRLRTFRKLITYMVIFAMTIRILLNYEG